MYNSIMLNYYTIRIFDLQKKFINIMLTHDLQFISYQDSNYVNNMHIFFCLLVFPLHLYLRMQDTGTIKWMNLVYFKQNDAVNSVSFDNDLYEPCVSRISPNA